MKQYTDLVKHVLAEGTVKKNRTGTDTVGVFGYFYKHNLQDGFPLLTTKAMKWEHIVLENLWFLSGSNKAEFLRHYDIKFWEPWTDKDGIVANCYGPAWMRFPTHTMVDGKQVATFNNQIAWALQELRNNPLSRRIVISAWSPGDAQTARLPPCHITWVLNTQVDADGALCLNLALIQRSCDIALGVPYNLAGYSFLLQLMAHLSGLRVGSFAHTLVDAHIYVNHVHHLRQQIQRDPRALPVLRIDTGIKELADIDFIIASRPKLADIINTFKLEGYNPHPPISYTVAV